MDAPAKKIAAIYMVKEKPRVSRGGEGFILDLSAREREKINPCLVVGK